MPARRKRRKWRKKKRRRIWILTYSDEAVGYSCRWRRCKEEARLLSTKPAHNAFIDCQPDGAALGCLATLVFTFNEDVFRGSGNVTLACLTNMALCREVVVPVDLPGFDGGSTQYRNSDFIVDFTTPLVDASSYKVSIDAGVVVDWRGNTFSLDVTCPASFNDAWRGHGNFDDLCADAFTFKTPS
eukprot:TRINITY_DN369_c0_g1_i4.p2 TRINITY_DN369_c0_g1~~TRINITY_DN369_c0_g1_i4.p2  ORF type:complete len:185 (-),score=30.67 TRINITY_DN369_c0_g1_i4:141-695(-)